MSAGETNPKRVVVQYEEEWSTLRAQLDEDRRIGLTDSGVRNAIVDWFDENSFVELGTLVRRASSSYRGGDAEAEQEAVVPADGLIAGWGEMNGQLVFVSADELVLGGEIRGGAAAAKATRVRAHALEQSAPLIQVFAAGRCDPDQFVGAEFVRFGFGVDTDFEQLADQRILKIGIVTAALGVQASLEATWCHLVVLSGAGASLFGHSGSQALGRGLADLVADDLPGALETVGQALRHLPRSRFSGPVRDPAVHTDRSEAEAILDAGWSWELTPDWCTPMQSHLGQIGGTTVGYIASRGPVVVDRPVATKLLRTAAFCRTFGCPLIIDHAGFDLPPAPLPADVHAIRGLAIELASPDAAVLEVARQERFLQADLGVRPLWTLGLAAPLSPNVVQSITDLRSEIINATTILQRRRPRHDQDERVRTRPPRTLKGD